MANDVRSRDRKSCDVFISHASEDKESFVRPLAHSLRFLGASVWYDEFSLRLGDSLSASIDRGLADSTFGVVVISPAFIQKDWTKYEFRGLVARDVHQGRVIFPIWHGVSREQVMAFSPPLADKVALRTEGLSVEDVAIQILCEVRPDLYSQYTRAELQRLASGTMDESTANIVVGARRIALLAACRKLLEALAIFREILGNLMIAAVRMDSAYAASDYEVKRTRADADGILQRLKADASDVLASSKGVRQAWRAADPHEDIAALFRVLPGSLELAEYVASTVDRAATPTEWWVREKLEDWVAALPKAEASLGNAIDLLTSWANFDPELRDQ